MISTHPLEKKLVHNFEVFSFKDWSYNIKFIMQCESCILVFKSNLAFVIINHDQ
jgi:hypothetical protein